MNRYVRELSDRALALRLALAGRELMQDLRESGEITGGPRPFSKSDRSEFLNRLETTVQTAKRLG